MLNETAPRSARRFPVLLAAALVAVTAAAGCAPEDGVDAVDDSRPTDDVADVGTSSDAISAGTVCRIAAAGAAGATTGGVYLLATSGGCTGLTLATTAGTTTVVCAVPAAAGVVSVLSGLTVGALVYVTCPRGGSNVRASYTVSASRYRTGTILQYSAADYEAFGASASAAAAAAQCRNSAPGAGCTPSEWQRLNNAVESDCHDPANPLLACAASDTCGRAQWKVGRLRTCITSRNRRESRCYCGGDTGHQTQIAQLEQQIGRCARTLPACF